MRLTKIHAKAYGCFTDRVLDLSPDKGFHIIYGPNEAGKSTLLRGITHALYGMPRVTGDAHLHDNQALRMLLGLVNEGGTHLLFQRRKGLKNTVLDEDNNSLDEEILHQYLGETSRELFQEMFGLNHVSLREGGESLVKSGGAMGVSLFGAATGLTGISDIIELLENQARDLYKPAGSKPKINELIAHYKDAKQAISQASLTGRDWQQQQEQYQELVGQRDQLSQALTDEKIKLQTYSRVKRGLSDLATRRDLLAKLQELEQLPNMPEDAMQQRLSAVKQIELAQADLDMIKETHDNATKELNELSMPKDILSNREGISELQEKLGLYRTNRDTLPIVSGEIAQLDNTIASLMRRTFVQVPAVDQVEALRLADYEKKAIEKLANQYIALEKSREVAKDGLAEIRAQLDDIDKHLEELGEAVNLSLPRAQIKQIQKCGDIEQQLTEKDGTVKDIKARVEKGLATLGLWQGTLEELGKLPIPSLETVEIFAGQLGKLNDQIEGNSDRIKQKKLDLDGIQSQLRSVELGGDVPTDITLQDARSQRDMGWQLVKRSWLEGIVDIEAEQGYTRGLRLDKAFEDSVANVDHISDRMRQEAEKVGEKAALLKKVEDLNREVIRLTEDADELQSKLHNTTKQWEQRWRPLGIKPLSPREMQQWLKNVSQLLDLGDQLYQARESRKYQQQSIVQGRQKLVAALAGLGYSHIEEQSISRLLHLAEEICDELQERNRLIKSKQDQRLSLERSLDSRETALRNADKAQASWQEQWTRALDKLALPLNTGVEEAMVYCENLDSLFQAIDEKVQCELEQGRVQQWIVGFAEQVQTITDSVAPDLLEMPPDLALIELGKRLSEAQTQETVGQRLTQLIEEQEIARDQALKRKDKAEQALAVLLKQGHCDSVEALEEIERRIEQQKNWQIKLAEIEEQLLQNGDGLTFTELVDEATDVDPLSLPGLISQTQARIEELELERSRVDQDFGAVNKEYKEKVQGSSIAATEAAEQSESILVSLREATFEYMRLRSAAMLLKKAIEDYREKNQSPIINRASTLFNQLTMGSFLGLKVDFDQSDNPILFGLRDSNEIVSIKGMSDGTQDQLYLALRLASIEEFVARNKEPIPFIIDDILIHFDDDRSRKALQVLAGFSSRIQIVFFTHHKRILQLAKESMAPEIVDIHELEREMSHMLM